MAALRQYVSALITMSRPGFLFGILPIYLSGVALSLSEGRTFRLRPAVLGLLLIWTVQLMTHYNNEYRDIETDTATETPGRIGGGSQVLVSGIVPPIVAYVAALVTLLLSVVLIGVLFASSYAGPGIVALGGVAITIGWFYSSPPLELVARGVGEAAVALTVGGLVPATAYYLQTTTVSTGLHVLWLPLIPLAFATSVATALPDRDGDRQTGKRTLVVRLGSRQAGRVLLALIIVGWLFLGYSAVTLDAGLTAVLLVPGVLLIGAVARVRPSAVHSTPSAAEATAVATVVNLGWASLALNAILYVVWSAGG